MINAILIFNQHGKPRLTKFYEYCPENIQQKILHDAYVLLSCRPDHVCNFLEGENLHGWKDFRLVYRHYATLYFCFCVDSNESELGILDLIQVFVETLDKQFENVCELDIIFEYEKINYILDEVVMGGLVLETSMNEILTAIDAQKKLEKSEQSFISPSKQFSSFANRSGFV